jgi:hypothetical protein
MEAKTMRKRAKALPLKDSALRLVRAAGDNEGIGTSPSVVPPPPQNPGSTSGG